MTLGELKKSDKVMLTPADIAGVLNMNPQTIRILARESPHKLGFSVVVSEHKTRIPRIPFLKYLGIDD